MSAVNQRKVNEGFRAHEAIGFAALAVITATGFMLVLRGTMAVWPVGLAGMLSRLVSVGVLALWVGIRGRRWQRLNPAGVGGWLMLMGAVSILINLCWFAGMKWTTVTMATLLFRLDLLFVLLIGAALGLERLSAAVWIIVPVMTLGLALLVEIPRLNWAGHTMGDILIIIAAFGLAVNAFVIRRILRQMDVEAVALYNHAFSGLGFGLLLLAEGLHIPEPVRALPAHWLWIVVVGILAAVSLPLYYAALGRMAVWKLRVLMLSSPPLAAVTEWLLWGQVLHAGQWLGAVLLVGGAGALVLMDRTTGTTADTDLPLARGTLCECAAATRVADQRGPDDTTKRFCSVHA